MAKPIEFYFDFTSPYGYLASTRIEAIAEKSGRDINWHPILLGFVFKTTGSQPLTQIPLKGDYAKRDMERSARQYGIPYQLPTNFPVGTVAAARACLWLESIDSSLTVDVIHALYKSFFVDDIDISNADNVVSIASAVGVNAHDLTAALETPEVKGLLKTAVDDAINKGVFGSPFIIVDGEPFWGHDRLNDVEQWLTSGGW